MLVESARSVSLTAAARCTWLRAWWPHLMGVAALAGLLACVPLDAVATSVRGLGLRVLPLFALASAWMAMDALAVWFLVGGEVSWGRLCYQQLVSEAIGAAVPLMGLAGEPWRARELASSLSVDEACAAVVRLRVVHAASGMLHAAWTMAVAVLLVALPSPWPWALAGLAVLSGLLGTVTVVVALTKAPARVAAAAVQMLGLPDRGARAVPARRGILGALLCKMLARVLQMLEIAAVLALLGVPVSPTVVIAVAASIAFSATAFFVMPQGLGVSEAAITTASVLLGLPASLGLTLALVRRARIVAWTVAGLGAGLGAGLLGGLTSLTDQPAPGKLS